MCGQAVSVERVAPYQVGGLGAVALGNFAGAGVLSAGPRWSLRLMHATAGQ